MIDKLLYSTTRTESMESLEPTAAASISPRRMSQTSSDTSTVSDGSSISQQTLATNNNNNSSYAAASREQHRRLSVSANRDDASRPPAAYMSAASTNTTLVSSTQPHHVGFQSSSGSAAVGSNVSSSQICNNNSNLRAQPSLPCLSVSTNREDILGAEGVGNWTNSSNAVATTAAVSAASSISNLITPLSSAASDVLTGNSAGRRNVASLQYSQSNGGVAADISSNSAINTYTTSHKLPSSSNTSSHKTTPSRIITNRNALNTGSSGWMLNNTTPPAAAAAVAAGEDVGSPPASAPPAVSSSVSVPSSLSSIVGGGGSFSSSSNVQPSNIGGALSVASAAQLPIQQAALVPGFDFTPPVRVAGGSTNRASLLCNPLSRDAAAAASSGNFVSAPPPQLLMGSGSSAVHHHHNNAAAAAAPGVRLSFASDKHASLCLEMFNYFRQSDDLIDVHVVVDDKRIACHKIVLSASSPYFRAMFTTGYYDESKQSTRQVVIHDVDAYATELLITFMYTGKIIIDEDNVQLLLPVARLFHLNEVVGTCCDFLNDQLHPHNCLGIRNFADAYSCAELKEHADKYATQNFLDIVQYEEFLLLPAQQLIEIVASDELNCPNEEDVFNAVMRWIYHDVKERKQHVFDVMQHVRLPLLTPEFLVGTVATDMLLRGCTRSRDLIDDAKDYHLLPAARAQQQGTRFRARRPVPCELLFAVGGWCSGDAISTVERYDSLQNEWRCVQPMSERRCGVGVAVLDGTIYAVGGHNGQQYLNSVERYDAAGNVWHSDVTNTKCCRTSVGVAVMDGFLYAVGGQDGVSCLNIVERYEPKTNRWTQVQPMNEKRLGVAVGVLNGSLYACGGSNGEVPLNSVERYEHKTDRWAACAPMRTKRKHLGCAVVDGWLYVAGGRDDSAELATCERYDPRRDLWESIASMNSHRSGVGLAVVNGTLYACGGFDGQNYLKSCECYDAENNAWRAVAHMTYRRLGGGVAVLNVKRPALSSSSLLMAAAAQVGGKPSLIMSQASVGNAGGGNNAANDRWNPLGL